MDRARVEAILSGQAVTLKGKSVAARPLVIPDDRMMHCAGVLSRLCDKVSSTRPLALEPSQLPPIF